MQGRQCIAFTWHTGHKQGRLRQQGFLPAGIRDAA